MRKSRPRGGIERKILTVIIWVGILPMALALIIGYLNFRAAQRHAVFQGLADSARLKAEGVQLAYVARLGAIKRLARDAEIVKALTPGAEGGASILENPEEVGGLVERLRLEARSTEKGLGVYTLYDAEGHVVASSRAGQGPDPRIVGRLEAIDEARFVGLDYSEAEDVHMCVTVAPVRSPETGAGIGYVAEMSAIENVIRFALGQRTGPQDEGDEDVYQFFLRGEEGRSFVMRLGKEGDDEAPTILFDEADEELAAIIAGSADTRSDTVRLRHYNTGQATTDVLLAYHRLDAPEDVYMVAYRPAFAAFAGINRMAAIAIFCSFSLIAFLCVLAYRNVHNNIALPISLLNEGAQIIRRGDLELKLKIGTGDEIEELASSFNKMALALSRNIRQLGESEEKYRSLVTSMRDGIYQTNPEGVITFCNPAGIEILGFSCVDEMLGQSLREMFLEEIDFAHLDSEMAGKGFVERSRVWMKRRGGKAICVELSANRVTDDEGHIVGTEGIFRDVTTTVRLEQDARERSERIGAINQIANVINSSLQVGRLYDSLVVEVKKLVNFDYAAVALLNAVGDAFEARQLWPEQEGETEQNQVLDGEASCSGWVARERQCLIVGDVEEERPQFAGQFPEGTRSCVCVPLYATGRIIGTLNLGSEEAGAYDRHDVEVLEQMAPHVAVAIRNAQLLENLQASLEEVTRAREKLHEANEELKTLDEMKTNLLSNVSHELRTPLVAVMGYTDMIYNEKAGPINGVQREYLEISLRNIEKLVTLIENLLDFSRLHRGAETLVFDTFDLVDCARTGIQIVRPVADTRDISMKLVATQEPILVEGDKGKLGQVFNNLLSNAVKFNRKGGSVTVELRCRDEAVEVAVSDTGIGIPEEALDKVFTRFYQYDSSSTRKYGGTGIGLSIAQDIVRLHGSRITVTSEAGQGSTFRFSLPVHAQSPREGPVEPKAEKAAETHLVVELVTRDRALSVEVRNLLGSESMDVIHASTAELALSLAEKHRPDCLVLDGDANGSDGMHVDTLLANASSEGLPVVLLTGDEEVYERCRGRIASRVRRNFRKSTLLSGIRYALSNGVLGAETSLGNKILCVDDDREVLRFMCRCLENGGYGAVGCASGEEAVEQALTGQFGLVLLDIAMPGIDGWETCRRIRAELPGSGIKVYMVTAKPVASDTSRLREAGADGCLLKPFRAEELLEVVRGLNIRPMVREEA